MRLRERLKAEWERIGAVPREQRLSYVLQYYWLWLAGTIGGFLLLAYIIHGAFFTVKENWFYAVFVNLVSEDAAVEGLREDFISYEGFDLARKNVVINANSYFDASISGGTNNSYFQAFVALVESGDLDVVVTNRDNLAAVGRSGRLLDLAAEPYAGLFSAYESRFIYCEPYDEDYSKEPVPIGIDISGAAALKRHGLYQDGAALGIGAMSSRVEAALSFIEFLEAGPSGGKERHAAEDSVISGQ